MREPLVGCPVCNSSYKTIAILQRHAKDTHGIATKELNKLINEDKDVEEKTERKKETKRVSKRARKLQELEDSSDGSVGKETSKRKGSSKQIDIIEESMSGIEPIYESVSPAGKEEVVQVEVYNETPSMSTSVQNQQDVKNSTPKTQPKYSKGKFITINIPVRKIIERKNDNLRQKN